MPKSDKKGSCRLFNINVEMTTVLKKISQTIDILRIVCLNLFLTQSYFSVAFSNASSAQSNSLQHKPTHLLKDHHMAIPGKSLNTWKNPPPFLQSHLISTEHDF